MSRFDRPQLRPAQAHVLFEYAVAVREEQSPAVAWSRRLLNSPCCREWLLYRRAERRAATEQVRFTAPALFMWNVEKT